VTINKLKLKTMRTRLINDIQKTKDKLVQKAKKKGLWENFGQDDVHRIRDKYDYHSLVYGDVSERKLAKRIENFNDWCVNFNDRDLRNS
jgi:hypothetical protein